MRPLRYDLDVTLDLDRGRLLASARILLRNEGPDPCGRESLLLNRGLAFASTPALVQSLVPMEDRPAQQVVRARVELPRQLTPGEEATLEVTYRGHIADYVDTGMSYVRDRIDPGFTILRPDAFAYPIPGPPSHRELKTGGLALFDWSARVTVPSTHEVACVGEPVSRTDDGERTAFVFRSARPSWRMDFAVARYEMRELGGRRLWHFAEDREGGAAVMEAVSAAFELYERWLGPLPGPSPFAVIEVPDGWGAQADVTGILQPASAFRDPARLVEVYHEISHLFGVPCLDRCPPRWDEGLAMFLAYRVADHLDGSDRGREAVERSRNSLLALAKSRQEIRRVPMAGYGEEGLTDLSYHVGMLMFGDLWKKVGQETFDRILSGFRHEFRARGATTVEFAHYAENAAGRALQGHFQTWMFSTDWWERLGGMGD